MKMTIPKDTLQSWNTLRERGDIPKLVKLTGLSRSSLYNVFDNGEVPTAKAAGKLLHFFLERERERNSVKQQLDQE